MKGIRCWGCQLTGVVCTLVVLLPLPGGDLRAQQSAAPITTVTVKQAPLKGHLKLTGSVEARRHSVLSAELSGLVSELYVDDGDPVSAGDLLLKLRDQPSQLQADFQRAGQRRADASVKLARLKEKRQGELLQSQAAAQDSYDIAEAELRRASADLAAARARVALIEDELQRHRVKAPFAGVISRKQTEVGSWVRPGDPLLNLDEMAVLRITAPLPQRYFSQVEEGSEVMLQFPALPGEQVAATVSRKVTAANPTSRTFPLLIDLPNPDNRLAPGMSVDIYLQLAGADQPVLQVAVDALVRRADGSTLLWKVVGEGEQGEVAPVAVSTGRAVGGLIEITDGPIAAGDRVVEQGNERMRPGLPVRILAEH
ncbi:MAG: efflux RND transporter periplasmic adaptor subunit [Gammaproteobacteria bacterium]